ncbi:MAG: Atxe2 family lasso peptide isopeptidase [Dokdonella sp.]|nr:Atxe2 family lasso peptide isopeptidase [Dokdonella sp.]
MLIRLTKKAARDLLAPIVWATALAGVCDAGAVSPRQLVEVIDIGSPAVSPDGRYVAFRLEQASIERNTYDSVWYVQQADGYSPPVRLADGGVPLRDSAGVSLPTVATWSPDGRWIYYRALLDGRIEVWRVAVDGSGAEPIAVDSADVRSFSLTRDGRVLMYSVGASREDVIAVEQAEYDNGIRIDQTVPVGQGVFRSGNLEGRLATQRYVGSWFDRGSLLSDTPVRWRAVDLVTRARRDLAEHDAPPAPLAASDLPSRRGQVWKLAQQEHDGRIALVVRDDDSGRPLDESEIRLYVLGNPQDRNPAECRAELCRDKPITSVVWRPDSNDVLYTVTDPAEGLAQSIFRWSVNTGDVQLVMRSTGLVSGGRDPYSGCGVSHAALVCVAAEADRPPRLERIDIVTGERRVLFDPNAALAQDLAQAAPVRLLRWSDANGQPFTGQFFPATRADSGPPPLFVTYYSCDGFLRGGLGDQWPLASMAASGIAALCINRAPGRILDAVQRYDLGRSAIESVVELLASSGEIDRAHIGMGGLSFGSEVTLWTAAHSDLLAAASITSPLISPNYYLVGSLKGDAFLSGLRESWQLGPPDETPERWRVLSPVFYLDRIRAPILMQMPEQEYLYALDYAIPLIRAQRADLYVFPHEPHQMFQPRHKVAAYQRNLDWFGFWLKGVEDEDPAKAAQYVYWRSMKQAATTERSRDSGR